MKICRFQVTVLLAAWVPERERGKLGAFVLGGTQVYTIQIFPSMLLFNFFFKKEIFSFFFNFICIVTAWKCFLLLHIRTDFVVLAMASCILRLELHRFDLVHIVCRFENIFENTETDDSSVKSICSKYVFSRYFATAIPEFIRSFQRKNVITFEMNWVK